MTATYHHVRAGIVVLDPAAGSLEMEVTPELRNPAGTLQGAMVALFAEAAAEELARTTPLPHNAFKVPLARNVMVRTLLDLVEAP